MPKINLLPQNVAELIAAGEVVERPASIIKELIENSIDAGADIITVEIQRGGITYIRVTDNGCGITFDDVPTAFLRHATSKIRTGDDLDSISTLGFRGEALAAVSSVSRVEMLTTAKGEKVGTHYSIEGGQELIYEESGCPEGTTIIIRDIFYNTPARMKFLKKDVSEANACAAIIDRIALSHPEISFRFIRDGKQTISTSGDSDLKGVVYSVLGRDFSTTLMNAKDEIDGVSVEGLICKPINCRPTRNNQYTFLNGRFVRSGTVVAAVEQAYKNSSMIGKFPSFVLYLNVPYTTVDVNVHPAKTEVRFSDEKRIFDAVYGTVKNALAQGDIRPEIKLRTPSFNRFEHMTTIEYQQQKIDVEKTIAEKIYDKIPIISNRNEINTSLLRDTTKPTFIERYSYIDKNGEKSEPMSKIHTNEYLGYDKGIFNSKSNQEENIKNIISDDIINEQEADKPFIKIIGEAFSTYIIAQMGESVFMIDKHAAHERIIFNELVSNHTVEIQNLLTPISVILAREEYDAIINNTELLLQSGFEVEDFGNSTIVIRTIPSILLAEDISSIISEIAERLLNKTDIATERENDIFHTVSCKAAIKAGGATSVIEMQKLAERVLYSKEIMYCPHGRPVAFEIKKRDLEKQFGRIQ